jgi:hypothetical protein
MVGLWEVAQHKLRVKLNFLLLLAAVLEALQVTMVVAAVAQAVCLITLH